LTHAGQSVQFDEITGVMKSVRSGRQPAPPTTATPSGWRSSGTVSEPKRGSASPPAAAPEGRHHDRPETPARSLLMAPAALNLRALEHQGDVDHVMMAFF